MISDHTGSDRNNDGWDSPSIWNDLMNNNGSIKNPFGIHFDSLTFSATTYSLGNTKDSCLSGPKGTVTGMQYNGGTTMTLDTAANPKVTGLIYRYSTKGTTSVMVARSRYGKGKIVACGDSSPMDDGTGDPNDKLYKSYTGTVSNSHQKLCVNSVIWLAATNTSTSNYNMRDYMANIVLYPNPAHNSVTLDCETWSYHAATVMVRDILGNTVEVKAAQLGRKLVLNTAGLSAGIYFANVQCEGSAVIKKFVIN
jgi:hypothetical protein